MPLDPPVSNQRGGCPVREPTGFVMTEGVDVPSLGVHGRHFRSPLPASVGEVAQLTSPIGDFTLPSHSLPARRSR